jgi:hypothetical protein
MSDARHPAAPAMSNGRLPTLSSNIIPGKVDRVLDTMSCDARRKDIWYDAYVDNAVDTSCE